MGKNIADFLRPLSPEELEKFEPITEREIYDALRRGLDELKRAQDSRPSISTRGGTYY